MLPNTLGEKNIFLVGTLQHFQSWMTYVRIFFAMKKHVISFLGIALSHYQQRSVHFVTICVSQKGNDVREKYLMYVIQLWKRCNNYLSFENLRKGFAGRAS